MATKKAKKTKIRHKVFMPPKMKPVPPGPVLPKISFIPPGQLGRVLQSMTCINGPWHGKNIKFDLWPQEATIVFKLGSFRGRYVCSNNYALEWQNV